MTRVGLISDTHGLLRPEALEYLRGSSTIIHAGDIGNPSVLQQLATIAPVTAVRGNNDKQAWAARIPESVTIEVAGCSIHVIHDIAQLDSDAANAARVIVSGHSHRPSIQERSGVLYVNPGSAGPRRFKLPVSAAELRISGKRVTARFAQLEVAAR